VKRLSDRQWTPGEVIAERFRVVRELGRGGMGVVLAAETLDEGRPVALKVLLHPGNEEARHRFAREARAAAQLDPEHVCPVLDTGVSDEGLFYIVMALLDGEDLGQRLDRTGPAHLVEAVDLVLEACEALAEAHLSGIVHRDIKPSNLFHARSDDGALRVRVLDFGIAKASRGTGHTTQLTGTGAVLGTPEYMAPEQLVSTRDVDHRADIWALGITLYELITADQAFDGDTTAALFAAVLRDPPKGLPAFRAPAKFERVVHRCLEKDPDDRYPNVAELALALEPFASHAGRGSVERIVERFEARGWRRPSVVVGMPLGTFDPAGPTALPESDREDDPPGPRMPLLQEATASMRGTQPSRGWRAPGAGPHPPHHRQSGTPGGKRLIGIALVLALVGALVPGVVYVALRGADDTSQGRGGAARGDDGKDAKKKAAKKKKAKRRKSKGEASESRGRPVSAGSCPGLLCDDELRLDDNHVEPSARVAEAVRFVKRVTPNPELMTVHTTNLRVVGPPLAGWREKLLFRDVSANKAYMVTITRSRAVVRPSLSVVEGLSPVGVASLCALRPGLASLAEKGVLADESVSATLVAGLGKTGVLTWQLGGQSAETHIECGAPKARY
jgi:serine/threonine-protein kinase